MGRSLILLGGILLMGCGGEPAGKRPAVPSSEPGTVTGRLVDSNGAPVPTALVTIESDPVEVSTDSNGRFSAAVPAGDHHLSAVKHGNTFASVDFTLEPGQALDLGDVRPSNPFAYARLALRDAGYMRANFAYEHTWCTLTLEDEQGLPITGLGLDDATVHEAIVSRADGTVAAEATIDLPAQVADAWTEAGLWEHTIKREPVDVVFLVDATGSMDPFVGDLQANINAFVDSMLNAHVDLRVAGVRYSSSAAIYLASDIFRFAGSWELDRLRTGITMFDTAGEGWSPTVTYDALMLSEWLGYRPEARKVAVVVTDIVPQTVYGTFWYAPGASVASASAAELYLLAQGVELFYSQNPAEHGGLGSYYDSHLNPRAGDAGSGLPALAGLGLATDLGWPFAAAALTEQLVGAPAAPIDSQYLVAWESTFAWADWSSSRTTHDLRLTVTLDAPGGSRSVSFTLPLSVTEAPVVVRIYDERMQPTEDVRLDIYHLAGGRPVSYDTQLRPVGGTLSRTLPPGRYLLEIYDSGRHGYDDTSLRAIARQIIEVGPQGVEVDISVAISERAGELAKARGLLRDLDGWRISGAPFCDFVDDARSWLDAIDANGMTWQEMAALRRFNTALAGYANLTEYAQLETERAVEDFVDIVEDFRNIVEQVQATQKSTAGELQQELKQHVIAQLPTGELFGPLQTITLTLIDADFNSGGEGNWKPVVEAAQRLLLDVALLTARETLGELAIEEMVDAIPVEQGYQTAIRGLLRNIVGALVRREHSMAHLETALEKFAQDMGSALYQQECEQIIATINRIFDALQAQLGAVPEVRDFVVGFARDLTLAALPTFDGHRMVYRIDSDQVVEILIRHGLYNVILRHYYVDETNRGLNRALVTARAFQLPAGSRDEWEAQMGADFWDLRTILGNAQTVAWNALSLQNEIQNWANALEGLADLLRIISGPLDFVAALYPPLEDTAENLHGLIAALDGAQIVTQAIEFGLKLDALGRFGDLSETLYTQAFPH